MKRGKVERIVALVALDNSVGQKMLSGMLAAVCGTGGCRMSVFHETRELTPETLGRLCRDAATGFIVTLTPEPDTLSALARLGRPVVCVNVREAIGGSSRVRYVWNDNAAIGHMAADHLVRQGFRAFAFAGVCGEDWSKGRRLGFRAALPKAAPCEETEFPLPPLDAMSRRRLGKWVEALAKPVAVFAVCDDLAAEIAAAARRKRLGIPTQVAVIGADDDSRCVTTVMPDYWKMGNVAAKTLLALMHGKRCPTDPIDVEPKRVVVRASTRMRGERLPLVEGVRDYVREHYAEDIGIDGIAAAVGVSRSTLVHRFRELTGQSVREAVEEERLKNVCRLLRAGKLSLAEIARSCGFSSAIRLSHVFRRRFGISPGAWGLLHRPACYAR